MSAAMSHATNLLLALSTMFVGQAPQIATGESETMTKPIEGTELRALIRNGQIKVNDEWTGSVERFREGGAYEGVTDRVVVEGSYFVSHDKLCITTKASNQTQCRQFFLTKEGLKMLYLATKKSVPVNITKIEE